jgi:high affinity Mn2+ porin
MNTASTSTGAPVVSGSRLSFDYPLVVNPAYNVERGPLSLFAARAHFQF